jgi:hypothetical protein
LVSVLCRCFWSSEHIICYFHMHPEVPVYIVSQKIVGQPYMSTTTCLYLFSFFILVCSYVRLGQDGCLAVAEALKFLPVLETLDFGYYTSGNLKELCFSVFACFTFCLSMPDMPFHDSSCLSLLTLTLPGCKYIYSHQSAAPCYK